MTIKLPSRLQKPFLWTAFGLLLATLTWAFAQSATPPTNLAADLPPGALMTLEAPDFATLLRTWNQSPEQRTWLTSANYSAFSNSHLFSRLADAQSGFANAAKVDLDGGFLQQIAGRESIFAWYNIGNLEFLYITHLPHDQATRLSLLQQRAHFARRESAGTAFYVRTASGPAPDEATDSTDTTDTTSADASADSTDTDSTVLDQPRTVAFALRGDWLLLATREDLLANALQLMATQSSHPTAADSEATEGWFAAADAAGPTTHGDLHMLLDLQSLTQTPQFRSYWIQRNITDTRQYRAAVVDLYREPTRFREERTLLPLNPPETPGDPAAQPDLATLEGLVPDQAGTYRILAQPSTDSTLATLEQKLFPTSNAASTNLTQAPPDTTALLTAGSATDLDLRIDTPPAIPGASSNPEQSLAPLRHLLDAAQLQSTLTVQRTAATSATQPFVHTHTALVLKANTAWNLQAVTTALTTALSPRFTTGTLGLNWQPAPDHSVRLTGPHPMALYIDGPLAILSNDPTLFTEILTREHQTASTSSQPAQLIAAVRPSHERTNFQHLTQQLAQSDTAAPTAADTSAPAPDSTPVRLFADNLPSLAETFSALAAERLVQSQAGPNLHQTVTYTWSKP